MATFTPHTAPIRRLFERAAARGVAERTDLLAEADRHDPSLRRPVEALLTLDAQLSRQFPQRHAEAAASEIARWETLKALFEQARQWAPEERTAYLDEACDGDDTLRGEVESLLAYDDEEPTYFDAFAAAVRPLWGDLPAPPSSQRPASDDADASPPGDAVSGDAAPGNAALGPPPDEMVGQRITHYEVVERLGGGAMGVVYKAIDLDLERPVALKFLPPHLSRAESARERFVHEAKAASALDHPHIATVYEIGETEEGRLFIAMTYYDGETLKAKIARGALPADEAVAYATQVADGLACAHEAGIVHRDVKPANIMVTRSGVAKIVDFGLAKRHDVTLTQTGATLGTVAYMSPEQARGEAVDHRTDLWSLGVVLFEMLTGERPFRGTYNQAVLYAILYEEPLATGAPELPTGLSEVVGRCLQKDPAERYRRASALLTDLERALDGSLPAEPVPGPTVAAPEVAAPEAASPDVGAPGITVPDGDEASAAPSPRLRDAHRPRTLWTVGAALLLAALAAVGTWFLPASGPAPPEEQHLAVLPFRTIGTADGAFADGLFESLTSRLTQLEQFQEGALWVVPASEIDASMKPSEVRAQLGVTMIVTGSIQVEDGRTRLTLNLIDAVTQRQIASEQVDHRSTSSLTLQDEAALTVARMLQVELDPREQQVLTAGATTVPRANELYLSGRGYLRQHETPEELETAITLFERAIEHDAEFALAHAGLGEAFWRKYRLTDDVQWAEAAVRHSQHALQFDDRLAPVYITLGLIQSGRQQYEEALDAFRRALEIDPFNAEAYRRRGIVYRRQGRSEEAEEAYKQAIALKPDYWRGYQSLGILYHLTGRLEEALEQYQYGLQLAPSNTSLLVRVGAAHWELERLDEAIEVFERVLEVDSTHAMAISNLATAYFYQGRFERAARLYEKLLALHPHDYTVQGYLADAYYWSPGRQDETVQAYRKAIAMAREHLVLRTEDPDLLGSLATYYARLGARDTAMVFLQRTEAIHGLEQANAFQAFGRGELYEYLGDRERALEWMGYALRQGFGWIQVQHSPWLEELRRDPAVREQLASHRGDPTDT